MKHIGDDVPGYGKSAEAIVPEEEQFRVHGTDFRTPGQPSKRMAWVFRYDGRQMEDEGGCFTHQKEGSCKDVETMEEDVSSRN